MRLTALLPQNQFVRAVSMLAGGTAVAQALTIIAAPILTRLYTPEEFGIYAVYVAVVSILTTVASWGYQWAIPLPEDEGEAANLVALCLVIVLLMTLITAIIGHLYGDLIAAQLEVTTSLEYIWLVPLGLLAAGTHEVFYYWTVRLKRFSVLAGNRLKQALLTICIQLFGSSLGAGALVVGHASGAGVASALLAKSSLDTPRMGLVTGSSMFQVANRFRRFPAYTAWGNLINVVGVQLPPVLFAALFNPAAAGLYALTHRVLAMPVAIIGSAVSSVVFSEASEAIRRDSVGSLFKSVSTQLASIGMPFVLLFMVSGPQVFSFIFGAEWERAGQFAQWLTPWIYMTIITSPLSTILTAMEQQPVLLVFHVSIMIMRTIAIVIGYLSGDVMTALVLFSLSSTGCYMAVWVKIVRLTGTPVAEMISINAKAFLLAGLLVSPAIGATVLDISLALSIAMIALSCILIGFWYLSLLRRAYAD